MNRREALKGLGLSLGYVVATPAVLSILQSCKNETPRVAWQPVFHSKDEGIVLTNLVDLILPKTDDLPGALDVNIPKFIDSFIDKVLDKDAQEKEKAMLDAVVSTLKKQIDELDTKDYDALLSKFLRATPKEVEAFKKDKKNALIYKYLTNLRGKTIWAYKTSQKIGEEVLAYDPIPGQQLGCISLEEATGGKAWSL